MKNKIYDRFFLRFFLAGLLLLASAAVVVAAPPVLPEGPVYFQYNNLEQVDTTLTNGIAVPGGAIDINGDGVMDTPPSEGNWGVFNISTIQIGAIATPNQDINGGPALFFDDGPGGIMGQVSGVFYGIITTSGTTSTGGWLDFYWQEPGSDTIATADMNGASFLPTARTAANSVGKFTSGVLLARLAFDSGIVPGDTVTHTLSDLDVSAITGTGRADSFANVVDLNNDGIIDAQDGVWAPVLNGNWFFIDDNANGIAGEPGEMRDVRFSTFFNLLANWNDPDYTTNGILGLRSNDPGRVYVVPPTACIGDFVWYDTNNNGLQDDGEAGVNDVTVNLLDCSGNTLATTTTADMGGMPGYYLFCDLTPGDYNLEFILPEGYVFSPQNQGNDDCVDSDADVATGITSCTTLDPGESDLCWDAGIYIPCLGAIGDYVWEDANLNGLQDTGEMPLEGVTVILSMGGEVIATTTTDANGYYLFSDLCPGDYVVSVETPPGYIPTPVCSTDPNIEGDANCNNQPVTSNNDTNTTIDFGFYQPAALGDFVWEDLNNDGIQDAGEPGIPGVTVELYDCLNNFVASTTTDANGFYIFNGLTPGDYYVKFIAPTGYLPTLQDQGGDDALDSDADPNTGQTVCTTLESGEIDLTWDAGFYMPMMCPGTGTPGYWKNHPEAWPVETIEIGGVIYTKAEAIYLMDCSDGNKLITMFRSLVAAKLNAIRGCGGPCIDGTIAEADAWMAQYAVPRMPEECNGEPKVRSSSDAWEVGEPLYDILDAYNNGRLYVDGVLCAPSRDVAEEQHEECLPDTSGGSQEPDNPAPSDPEKEKKSK